MDARRAAFGAGDRLTTPSRDHPTPLAEDAIALRAAPSAARSELAPAASSPTVAAPALARHPASSQVKIVLESSALAPTDRAARIVLPLACAVSWLAIAAYQREPSVAAEARYLGVLTGAVLLAALQAAPRVGALLGAAVALLGAIPWALPGTADRGVAAGVLLAAILALAAVAGSPRTRGATAPSTITSAWPPSRLAALALGAQVLARGGDLLAPTTAVVVGIVAWAAIAAAAILILERQRGLYPAALAGATAFALGPGFTPTTALALAAPALGALAADDRRALRTRIVAAAALAAPLLWNFERGAFLVLAAVAFAGPRWARFTAGLAALIAFFGPGADRGAGVEGVAWLLVLAPIVVADLGVDSASWRFAAAKAATRFAAVCLGLAVAAQIPDRAALAIPAVLLLASVAGARPLPAALQASWTGVLAFAAAVLAAYPWLRAGALYHVVALFGLGESWRAALATLALLTTAAAACLLAGRGPRAPIAEDGPGRGSSERGGTAPTRLASLALAVLLPALLLLSHPAIEASPVSRQPIDLDARSPSWSARFAAPVRAATLVVDSSLSHAAAIAPGTVIAEVRLATAGGELTLPVRAGVDTGEWAARRPDVAAIAGFEAPEPYLNWVDAGRRFFGQRYRARLRLDRPASVDAVELRLAPGLDPDVALTLFHLELLR